MKKTVLLDEIGDGFRTILEKIERDQSLHDYGIPRQAWRRGVKGPGKDVTH